MLNIFIVYLLYFVKDVTMQKWCEADNQYPWSFHGSDNGPSHWGDLYPECKLRNQSPIAIKEDDVTESDFPELKFVGYDKPITKAKVQNVGWTVMITPEDGVNRTIEWQNTVISQAFELISIHFHFGNESDPGAEHVINGVRYPMEIHYFIYDHASEMESVLSTLMDAGDDDNSAFSPIIDILPYVQYRNDSTELKSDLDLSQLLPEMTMGTYYYYLYLGQNGIPPCQPTILWYILKDIGKVGKDQLDTFMTLYSVGKDDASVECLMGPNYRPVQNLDNRRVSIAPKSKSKD